MGEAPGAPEEGAKEAAAEERRRVAAVFVKLGMGLPLTEQDEAVLAYSPHGTAAGCGCGR